MESSKKCWRSLYIKLSAVDSAISDQDLKDELLSHIESFKHGLTDYDSPIEYWNFSIQKNDQSSSEMNDLYLKLIKLLQLEPGHCMAVFGNYLIHEFRHSNAVLMELVQEDLTSFLLSVWIFFSREKLFHLKCLHHIVVSSSNNIKSDVFKEFLDKFSLDELYRSLIKRYKHVVQFPLPSDSSHGEISKILIPYWIKYNLQEQVQLLRLLVVVCPLVSFDFQILQEHFSLIKLTLFGTHQYYSILDNGVQARLQRMICFLTNFHILQLLKHGWKHDIYAKHEESFKYNGILINSSNYCAEKGPLIAAWILAKCYKMSVGRSASKREIAFEYGCCDVDLWEFLLHLLESDLFQESPELFSLAAKLSDEMITLAFDYFGMNIFKNQSTLVSIVCTLAKWNGFKETPNAVTLLWNYYADIYPLDLASFIRLAEVIIEYDYCTSVPNNILQEIGKLKYNVTNPEQKIKVASFMNKHLLENPLTPLPYFPDVIITAGTEVTYNYENETLKLKYHIPLWTVIQNSIRTFPNENCASHDDTLYCIKFCHAVLKKDPHYINEMLPCIEDILNLLSRISSESTEAVSVDVLSACIDISCLLLHILPDDILRFYSSLMLLPDYDIIVKTDYSKFSSKYYNNGLLWSIIEMEEKKYQTHSVLMAYLKFLRKLTKDATNETWYILGGVMLIFNALVKIEEAVWHFKNKPKDLYLIIWYSVEILNEIFTKAVTDMFHDRHKSSMELKEFTLKAELHFPTIYFIAKYCVVTLLTNQRLIQAIATMGERSLFERMESCVSWSVGLSAVIINNVCSSVSLLYRSLILKEIIVEAGIELPKLSKAVIKEMYNPYSLFTYTYNCFSYPLKLLTIKFLTKLADEDAECISYGLNLPAVRLRREFLQPLYSSYVTNKYKVSLLMFIAKCIINQKIIANALIDVEDINKLIKLSQSKEAPNTLMSEITGNRNNLFSFIIQHLLDTFNTGEALDDMHCAILKIIDNVWKNEHFHLRKFFLIAPSFWNCLFHPLTQPLNETFLGYGFIMDIVSSEILKNDSTIDESLVNILKSFFDSERFLHWTKYCVRMINSSNNLSTMFKSISVEKRTISKSWQNFLIIVAARIKDIVRNPAEVASYLLKELVQHIRLLKFDHETVYITEMYFLFLNTWKGKCSTNWTTDLHLLCDIFEKLIEFNSYYPQASTWYRTLILIFYKIFTYGKDHLVKVVVERQEVMYRWFEFMAGKINEAIEALSKGVVDNITIPLYISFLTNAIITLKNHMINIILYTMKSVNLLSSLIHFIFIVTKGETIFETTDMVVKFLKMIVKECKVKNEFMDVDKVTLNLLCMIAPSKSIFSRSKETAAAGDKKSFLNNYWFHLYGDVLDIITLLIPEISLNAKKQVFNILPKHIEFLDSILFMAIDTMDENSLRTITSCMMLIKFIASNNKLRNTEDTNVIKTLMNSVRNYVFSIVTYLIHPVKIYCVLNNVENHTQLQQKFPDGVGASLDVTKVKTIYNRLLLILKLGFAILSEFTVHCELIYDMMLFGCSLKYINYFSSIYEIQSDFSNINLLPHLQWEEITLFISLIEQLQVATDRPKCDVDTFIKDHAEGITPVVLYVNSRILTTQATIYFLSELAKIFLMENIPFKEKQMFATEIYIYMKNLIINAKSSRVNISKNFPTLCVRKRNLLRDSTSCNEYDEQGMSESVETTSHQQWICNKVNSGYLYFCPADSTTLKVPNTSRSSLFLSTILKQTNLDNSLFRIGVELDFDKSASDDDSSKNSETVNDIALYCTIRLIYKLLLLYKYD